MAKLMLPMTYHKCPLTWKWQHHGCVLSIRPDDAYRRRYRRYRIDIGDIEPTEFRQKYRLNFEEFNRSV